MTPLTSGTILIDERDIARVPLRQLRASVGVVSQQPFLFEGADPGPLQCARPSEKLGLVGNLLACCRANGGDPQLQS